MASSGSTRLPTITGTAIAVLIGLVIRYGVKLLRDVAHALRRGKTLPIEA